MQVRCPGRGNSLLGEKSGLVSGHRYLFENGNSKKFSQCFVSKHSFYKLSWLRICSCLRNFSGFLTQSGFSKPSSGFDRISNQFGIWVGFREKMVYWG